MVKKGIGNIADCCIETAFVERTVHTVDDRKLCMARKRAINCSFSSLIFQKYRTGFRKELKYVIIALKCSANLE